MDGQISQAVEYSRTRVNTETEPNRKPSQLLTREDTTPFCYKLVQQTQTLEEEQAYVREHYGDDFSCAGTHAHGYETLYRALV